VTDATRYLSKKQVDLLLQPIHPKRVFELDGMSYVAAWDIRAELNRVFGFGRWDIDILSQGLICETQTKTSKGKDAWYVVYKTSLRLTIRTPDGSHLAHYEESHVGESTHPVRGEAHGNALTNSHSYALKRCAHNLGDQFGLSLYDKGSLGKMVRWTLVKAEEDGRPDSADTDDVPQVTADSSGEAEPDPSEWERPPVTPDPETARWLDSAREAAASFTAHKEGVLLWEEANAKVDAGVLDPADAQDLQALITARHEDIDKQAKNGKAKAAAS
jgi:hypothetical protein